MSFKGNTEYRFFIGDDDMIITGKIELEEEIDDMKVADLFHKIAKLTADKYTSNMWLKRETQHDKDNRQFVDLIHKDAMVILPDWSRNPERG